MQPPHNILEGITTPNTIANANIPTAMTRGKKIIIRIAKRIRLYIGIYSMVALK
jgi:hypothetical protein